MNSNKLNEQSNNTIIINKLIYYFNEYLFPNFPDSSSNAFNS